MSTFWFENPICVQGRPNVKLNHSKCQFNFCICTAFAKHGLKLYWGWKSKGSDVDENSREGFGKGKSEGDGIRLGTTFLWPFGCEWEQEEYQRSCSCWKNWLQQFTKPAKRQRQFSFAFSASKPENKTSSHTHTKKCVSMNGAGIPGSHRGKQPSSAK